MISWCTLINFFIFCLIFVVLWRRAIESGYWAMTSNGRRRKKSKHWLCRVAGPWRILELHKQPLCIDRNSLLPSHFSLQLAISWKRHYHAGYVSFKQWPSATHEYHLPGFMVTPTTLAKLFCSAQWAIFWSIFCCLIRPARQSWWKHHWKT